MKILIVDDDIATVDMIDKVCDWKALGISEVLKAYDGEEAKALIQEKLPDIILCDIGMPRTNGISVLKWIRESRIDSEFVFLTCYSDYEYTREAVRFGALDYLTKPFEPQELFVCIQNAVARVLQKQAPNDNGQAIRLKTEKLLHAVTEGIYGTDRSDIQEVLKSVRPDLSADAETRIITMRIDYREAVKRGWKNSLFKSALEHIFIEMMTGSLSNDFIFGKTEEPFEIEYLFIPGDTNDAQYYIARAAEAQKFIRDHLGTVPLFIIGERIRFFESFAQYRKISGYMERNSFLKGKVVAMESSSEETEPAGLALDKSLIRSALLSRNKDQLINYVGSLLNEAILDEVHSATLIRQIHDDLMQIVLACMEENDIDAHTLFDDQNLSLLNTRSKISVLDMIKYVDALYDCCIAMLQKKSESAGVIAQVKQFIHEHCEDDLSRDTIAQAVYLTPNYLSKLFRREAGMTLRQYINDVRITEAKRLLATTDQSVSDIAMDLGFENVSYFSTVFKKENGLGPLAWRSRALGRPIGNEEE